MYAKLVWGVWWVSLAVCPVAIAVVGMVYESPTPIHGPRPWAAVLVDALFTAHLGVSAIAAVAVFWLVRGWPQRSVAWGAVGAVLCLTVVLYLEAAMAATGLWL
jgi:hypothetical protein